MFVKTLTFLFLLFLQLRLSATVNPRPKQLDYSWPSKYSAEISGDVLLGGLMMIHSRSESSVCGPIMTQGGIQALETMLYTIDVINRKGVINLTLGVHVLDDCDQDTHGLEMAVDFIKGKKRSCKLI